MPILFQSGGSDHSDRSPIYADDYFLVVVVVVVAPGVAAAVDVVRAVVVEGAVVTGLTLPSDMMKPWIWLEKALSSSMICLLRRISQL